MAHCGAPEPCIRGKCECGDQIKEEFEQGGGEKAGR